MASPPFVLLLAPDGGLLSTHRFLLKSNYEKQTKKSTRFITLSHHHIMYMIQHAMDKISKSLGGWVRYLQPYMVFCIKNEKRHGFYFSAMVKANLVKFLVQF